MFAVGAWAMYHLRVHIQDRVEIWLNPFAPQLVEHSGYQIAQSLFAQADGGLFGTGFGAALLSVGGTSLLPAADTDLIYSVIVNELGLAGACGLLLVYLLFVERGMKVAMIASDSFSKLLAVGPDVGVRAAGVRDRRRRHQGDPADRRDAAVRLLRRLLDRRQLRPAGAAAARLRPRAEAGAPAMNPPIVRLYAFFALLFGILVFATSWWAVFTAPKLRDNASNRRPLLAEERIKRGTIRSADGKVLARSVKIDKERYRRTYPTQGRCSPRRSATRTRRSAAPGSSSSATTR